MGQNFNLKLGFTGTKAAIGTQPTKRAICGHHFIPFHIYAKKICSLVLPRTNKH